jgi:hypothetical protein
MAATSPLHLPELLEPILQNVVFVLENEKPGRGITWCLLVGCRVDKRWCTTIKKCSSLQRAMFSKPVPRPSKTIINPLLHNMLAHEVWDKHAKGGTESWRHMCVAQTALLRITVRHLVVCDDGKPTWSHSHFASDVQMNTFTKLQGLSEVILIAEESNRVLTLHMFPKDQRRYLDLLERYQRKSQIEFTSDV